MRISTLFAAIALAIVLVSSTHLQAQTPVSVGAGSYASFPPASENTDDWNNDGVGDLYNFVFNQKINVAPNRINSPIPTNDWWTDLIINGHNCGMLWAYPLSIDPDNTGFKTYFANNFVTDGSNLNYGGYMHIGGTNFIPNKGYAKDWSDWGLVTTLADTTNNTSADITMAHGIPYMWVETKGFNPSFSFNRSASYLDSNGNALTFPITKSFVVSTDGRYFGVHLPGNTSAEIQGQQFLKIDLGSVQPITRVLLNWETAYAKGYSIAVSDNDSSYQIVTNISNGNGGTDTLNMATNGRYVKILLAEKGTIYAYSLYEVRVFNGSTLLSNGRTVTVSSTQGGFIGRNATDNNLGTRWASDGNQVEQLILNTNNGNSYLVISALESPSLLGHFEQFAFNKVTNTRVNWNYNVSNGIVQSDWTLETANLKGLQAGNTIQGFLPHLYLNASHNVNFTNYNYVSTRGTLKTAIGKSFSFVYRFNGVLPSFNTPFLDSTKSAPYDANVMYSLLTCYSKKTGYGGDTYWGGKDLVNFAKYTLFAKELNHQSYPSIKAKTREALTNWLTYTPGETEKFFARYDRWKALIGFNESFGSSQFTDNHFHYGYLIYASALYAMVDSSFTAEYGDMLRLVVKQYANYDRADTSQPFMRTFDPWIGHSYAGGTSSASGNNQESTSESMQAWIGMFLLGEVLGDEQMRAAAAFGYASESRATLEYWFDWKERNLPPAYAHNMVGILSNQGFAYGTFFSASPVHIHGIQYLPINPGFNYLAIDSTWAAREYADMMQETIAVDGHVNELDFGDDWAHVALGFRQLYDPGYVANFMRNNLLISTSSPDYIMDYEVAGITYYYTHARQNLGKFSTKYRTSIPSGAVFENPDGSFKYAVVFNKNSTNQVVTVLDTANVSVANFIAPAKTLRTYPYPPTTGTTPSGCYSLVPKAAYSSTGNASFAIDGNSGTRWESAFTDPQTLIIDMGVQSNINKITMTWEVANARRFTLAISTDSINWTEFKNITNTTTGNRTDIFDSLNLTGRFIRMYGIERNTPYGYSIYEFEVCGTSIIDSSEIDPRVEDTLPVTLLSFTGRTFEEGHKLEWRTINEVNNLGFGLERSTDGRTFSEVAFVNAQPPRNVPNTYSYQDNFNDDAYYRLRQTDKDGTTSLSPTIFLAAWVDPNPPITPKPPVTYSFKVYPNPAKGYVTITSSNAPKALEITDVIGKVVHQQQIAGLVRIPLNKFKAGLYHIKVQTEEGTQTVKLMVQ